VVYRYVCVTSGKIYRFNIVMSRQFLLYQKYPATPVVVEAKTFKEKS
jgi:hypothetical protein